MKKAGNYHFTIPSRHAFHKEYAGEIRANDFCTQHPNPRKFYPLTNTERKLSNYSITERRGTK